MSSKEALDRIELEIEKGMKLAKCRKCACMKRTLEDLFVCLRSGEIEGCYGLLEKIREWLKKMGETQYACLGCDYCFPAVATNILASEFPSARLPSLECHASVEEHEWPPAAGDYFAFCEGWRCPVALSTLATFDLLDSLARIKPKGLCVVVKTKTAKVLARNWRTKARRFRKSALDYIWKIGRDGLWNLF